MLPELAIRRAYNLDPLTRETDTTIDHIHVLQGLCVRVFEKVNETSLRSIISMSEVRYIARVMNIMTLDRKGMSKLVRPIEHPGFLGRKEYIGEIEEVYHTAKGTVNTHESLNICYSADDQHKQVKYVWSTNPAPINHFWSSEWNEKPTPFGLEWTYSDSKRLFSDQRVKQLSVRVNDAKVVYRRHHNGWQLWNPWLEKGVDLTLDIINTLTRSHQ